MGDNSSANDNGASEIGAPADNVSMCLVPSVCVCVCGAYGSSLNVPSTDCLHTDAREPLDAGEFLFNFNYFFLSSYFNDELIVI